MTGGRRSGPPADLCHRPSALRERCTESEDRRRMTEGRGRPSSAIRYLPSVNDVPDRTTADGCRMTGEGGRVPHGGVFRPPFSDIRPPPSVNDVPSRMADVGGQMAGRRRSGPRAGGSARPPTSVIRHPFSVNDVPNRMTDVGRQGTGRGRSGPCADGSVRPPSSVVCRPPSVNDVPNRRSGRPRLRRAAG